MTDVDTMAAITIAAATRNPRIMVGSPGNSAILEQRHDQVSDGIGVGIISKVAGAVTSSVRLQHACKLTVDIRQQLAYIVNCDQELQKQGSCRALGERTHRKD